MLHARADGALTTVGAGEHGMEAAAAPPHLMEVLAAQPNVMLTRSWIATSLPPLVATMRRLILICTVALSGCASMRPATIPTDSVALAQVRKIFLGDFGSLDGAEIVREKVRVLLLSSTRFEVVEREELADAVL